MRQKALYILAMSLILAPAAVADEGVIPEKTSTLFTNLTNFLNDKSNGCQGEPPTENTVAGWRDWSYRESSAPYHFGPCYANLRAFFKDAAVGYVDEGGNHFTATIIIDAYPNLIWGITNDSGTSIQHQITETVGAETTSTAEYGISFELGVEFGNSFGSLNSKFGFTMTQSTTESFSQVRTEQSTVEVPANQDFYLYQLAFHVLVFRGDGTGGGLGWTIYPTDEFVNLGDFTVARKSPY